MSTPPSRASTGLSAAVLTIGRSAFARSGAYAGTVGQAAFLTTSTTAGDQFVHTTANSYVTNSLPNSIIYVVGFTNVVVTAGGSSSIADLFDSPGNDTFTEVVPATGLLTGTGYSVQVLGFGTVACIRRRAAATSFTGPLSITT